jgi:hypothetical protein
MSGTDSGVLTESLFAPFVREKVDGAAITVDSIAAAKS